MNMEPPIAVDSKIDDKTYLLISILVDRKDFLEDIEKMRNRLNVTVPYNPPKYQIPEIEQMAGFYREGQVRIYDIWEEINGYCNVTGIPPSKIDKTLTTAVMFAESLVSKYEKSPQYLPVILGAILVGKIGEFDLLSTQFISLSSEDLRKMSDNPLYDQGKLTAILISPESKRQDVLRVFDHINKYYFKNNKRVSANDGLLFVYKDVTGTVIPDTIQNVKRDRKWYWMNKSMSYQRIFNQEENISESLVAKAVQQYRKRLV